MSPPKSPHPLTPIEHYILAKGGPAQRQVDPHLSSHSPANRHAWAHLNGALSGLFGIVRSARHPFARRDTLTDTKKPSGETDASNQLPLDI